MRKQFLSQFIFLGCFISFAIGSNTCTFCQSDTTITAELVLFPEIQHAQVFFVSDFDLMQLGTGPLLFRIEINNHGPAKNIFGRFSIVSENLGALLSGETRPFELAPDLTYLTNHELFSSAGTYALDNYNLENAAAELRSLLLRTGKLPTDTYYFKWQILDSHTQSIVSKAEEELRITNPTSLDLIAPGMEATALELPNMFTTFPLFQWESNASEFIVTVCERLNKNQSPEEVMNSEPRLRKEIKDRTYCQYPVLEPGVWPLEAGKTYYWQVTAKLPSSSGYISLPSEIWGFTIADQSSIISNLEQMRTINNLRTILGDEIVDALFGGNGELDGFTITGVVLLNGKRISLDDLTSLIEKVLSGEIKVKSFSIE